ncbi:hypothetical protein ACODGR_03225 [Vagococcus fluvialis]|uniref:hypothetical protein n=1 Tax=Vagococcus fluvialis TaxID=2738 RepID=UPI001A8F0AF9|nr:hypothetical protein [Vagococcus fluvialis]MBO0479298.1 hypothetical protein [Vagococcus fluvialis]MBO0485156.1 hypothetical protein [Vagococcus fluvialis]
MNNLTFQYKFENQEHFIETDFTNNGVEVVSYVIDTPDFTGSFLDYSNGIKILVKSDVTVGIVTYFTNTKLIETSPGRFSFDI